MDDERLALQYGGEDCLLLAQLWVVRHEDFAGVGLAIDVNDEDPFLVKSRKASREGNRG